MVTTAILRRAGDDQDQHRLVSPQGARPVCGDFRLHDQPRSVGDQHARGPRSSGGFSDPRLGPRAAAALAMGFYHSQADGICAFGSLPHLAIVVKRNPEAAGFHRPDPDEPHDASAPEPSLGTVILLIASNPAVWICALAYACTGAVRQGIDQWFPSYLHEVYHADCGARSSTPSRFSFLWWRRSAR